MANFKNADYLVLDLTDENMKDFPVMDIPVPGFIISIGETHSIVGQIIPSGHRILRIHNSRILSCDEIYTYSYLENPRWELV